MERKFLIFAPAYDPNVGGVVALHKLCSLLNELGAQAWVLRLFNNHLISRVNILEPALKVLKSCVKELMFPYALSGQLLTPVLEQRPKIFDDGWIVVYPEIVLGNPLQARNVVRWMLHRPGYHTGATLFGRDEFHVDYNRFLDGFTFPGCHKGRSSLYVVHFPFDIYNQAGALAPQERKGTAYCLRKGAGKPIEHDLSDSVLIDGKPHEEVAALFKRVNSFISYDPYTAYSSFAVLCGADSIVVPDPGISKEAWHPDPAERFGVAYGFDDMQWARETAGNLLGHMRQKEAASAAAVNNFRNEVNHYFDELRNAGR